MSLARLAPDAEHDLRLPQLAPLARSTPLETHKEALVEARVNALLYHVDAITPQLASIDEESPTAARRGAAAGNGEPDAVDADRGSVGPLRPDVDAEEDFSDINTEEVSDAPTVKTRAERHKENGGAHRDATADPLPYGMAELKAKPQIISNDEEGFSAYAQIPTYKKSYLRIDVKQAMAFFRRSLLEYIRIVFWLLKTTSIFGDFSVVFDGFKKWYSATFDYFDEAQWQDSDVDAAVFKTAGNFLSDTFNVDRANIKKILLRDETADALEPDDGELPNSSSHCRALQVLAGEVIRSAQILNNVFVELKDKSLENYARLVVKLPECVKFLEFNRKFVQHPSTGDQFEVRSDATEGWRAVVEMFFKRADLLGDCINGLDYGPGLQILVTDMIGLPNFVNSTPDVVVKPYFCSQNYLVLWARCTLLRYKKNDTEYKDLEAYLKQFNQSSEHLFKASKKNQDKDTAKKRTEEYRKLSEYRDIKTKGIYWHEQNVKLKKNGQYTKFYIASSDDRRLKNGMMQAATPEERAEYLSMPGAKRNSEVYKWTDTARGKDKRGGNGWDRGDDQGGGGHGGNGRFGQGGGGHGGNGRFGHQGSQRYGGSGRGGHQGSQRYGGGNSGDRGSGYGGANVRGGGAQGGTVSGTGADKRRYNPRGRGGGVVQHHNNPQAFYKDKTLHKDRKAEREAVETAHENYQNQRVHMQDILENIIQNSPKDYALWKKTMDELKASIKEFRALYGDRTELNLRRSILKSPKELNEDYKNAITQSTYLSEIGEDDSFSDDSMYDMHAKQDYSFKKPVESTDESDTDIYSQDGDSDVVPELSFGLSDLTQPVETSNDMITDYREKQTYMPLEPLGSTQMHTVTTLVHILEYMVQNPEPTQNHINTVQDTWNATMLDYNTTEQKFEREYAKMGFQKSAVNIFINYVQLLLGYKIQLSKKVGYYEEWCERAISQQDKRIEKERAMLQQESNTTPAVATSKSDTEKVAPTPPRFPRTKIVVNRPTTQSKSREQTSTAPHSTPLSDSRSVKQGAATKEKTNENKISVRDRNKMNKAATAREKAALAASPQKMSKQTQNGSSVPDSIELAGLTDLVNSKAHWKELMNNMMERREEIIRDLTTFNAGLNGKAILDRDALKQEITTFDLFQELVRTMESGTNVLVQRSAQYDDVLPLLKTFLEKVQRQEKQIAENYSNFEGMKQEFIAQIQERDDAARTATRDREQR